MDISRTETWYDPLVKIIKEVCSFVKRKILLFIKNKIHFPYIYIICAQSRNWTKDFVKLKLKEDQILYEESDTMQKEGRIRKNTSMSYVWVCKVYTQVHVYVCREEGKLKPGYN